MDGTSNDAVPTSAIAMPEVAGFTHEFVDTPGLRTHVAQAGEGDPVLMLHGFPQHWWEWRAIGGALADSYRVICPDLRGSGWTRAASPQILHDAIRGDMIGLLDALGIDRVRIVAHVMGAVVASHLAYQHPDRVHAMVVLAVPPPFMPVTVGMMPAFRHMPRFRFHRRGASLAFIFRPPYVVSELPPDVVATYLAPLGRPEVDVAVREVYRGLVGGEVPRLMSGAYRRQRLHVPSLYAFGEQDRPLTPDFVRRHCGDTSRFADRLEIAAVPDAAHFMTEDAPEVVEALVRDFFDRVG